MQSWDNFFLFNDVNLAWKSFKSTISKAFDMRAAFILKKVKELCLWLTSDEKKHMNESDKLLRKARRTCKEMDWSSYKRKKNLCTNTIRSAKAQYHKNMITENSVHSQLIDYLQNFNLFTNCQYGYRKSDTARSTEIATSILLHDIRKIVDR